MRRPYLHAMSARQRPGGHRLATSPPRHVATSPPRHVATSQAKKRHEPRAQSQAHAAAEADFEGEEVEEVEEVEEGSYNGVTISSAADNPYGGASGAGGGSGGGGGASTGLFGSDDGTASLAIDCSGMRKKPPHR